jgi:ribonuclease Z
MDKFIVLGSSNAIPKTDQQNAHLLAISSEKVILIDCGNHIVLSLGKTGYKINQVTDLILTHFHPDHVGSLPELLMAMWLEKRTTALNIYGLDVTIQKANALLELFGWLNWKGMYPVNFHSIPENGQEQFIECESIKVTALPVLHLIPNIGLRFEFKSGRIIVYTSDTEPCDNIIKLAKNADVLLQESAGESKGHTSAQQAGKMAAQAGVKKLILIHYDAGIPEKTQIDAAKTGFNGEVSMAKDGMEIL